MAKMGRPIIDLTDRTFGRLTVKRRDDTPSPTPKWWCTCECGIELSVYGSSLRNGDTRSCGCLNSETCRRTHSLPSGVSGKRALVQRYKRGAKKRGLTWDLGEEDLESLFKGMCHYCGAPPNQRYKPTKTSNGSYIYNGIDREDNSQGYISGNCVSCCGVCNFMKSEMEVQEFLDHVNQITIYQGRIWQTTIPEELWATDKKLAYSRF